MIPVNPRPDDPFEVPDEDWTDGYLSLGERRELAQTKEDACPECHLIHPGGLDYCW